MADKIIKLIKTPLEMERLGAFVASFTKSSSLITLQGSLGSGKSVFARGFIRSFGTKEHIVSPTFTLLQEYRIDPVKSGVEVIYHFDLYRLSSIEEFDLIGGSDLVYSPASVSLIEWPEILDIDKKKADTIQVFISVLDDNKRRVEIIKATV